MKVKRFDLELEVFENPFWASDFGTWEQFTFDCLFTFSDTNKTLIDVGAWIGPLSIFNHNKYKHIYSIEPDLVAFNQLKYNVENNNINNISLFNEAIYNDSVSELIIGSESLGNSNSRVNFNDTCLLQKTACGSFSTFLKRNKISTDDISIIKIDVEGSETEILKDDFFKNISVPVYLSIHPPFIKDYQSNIQPILDLCKQYKYRIPDVDPSINLGVNSIVKVNLFYSLLLCNNI